MFQAGLSFGCGTGLGCGSCGGTCGMGDGEIQLPDRFPSVEKVLLDYIRQEVMAGRPFYITQELNSDTVNRADFEAMGFWAAVLSAVTKVATTVGSAAVKAAPQIAQIAATSQQIKANYQATLANSGVQIPSQVASQAQQAALKDAGVLGTGMTQGTLLLVGGGLLALVLLSRK